MVSFTGVRHAARPGGRKVPSFAQRPNKNRVRNTGRGWSGRGRRGQTVSQNDDVPTKGPTIALYGPVPRHHSGRMVPVPGCLVFAKDRCCVEPGRQLIVAGRSCFRPTCSIGSADRSSTALVLLSILTTLLCTGLVVAEAITSDALRALVLT